MSNVPKILDDNPVVLAQNFGGYQHRIDPTVQDFNTLTYPTSNCSIPTFDKIIPDKGKTLIGQVFTQNSGIIGNREKFKNLGGVEMEVRVWKDTIGTGRDVIEVLYNNVWIPITESNNPLPQGLHEFYFDEWFDTKLLSTVPNTTPSKSLPRLIWVNGLDSVFSWTGGLAEIVNVIPNTSITITGTFREFGFTEDANGDAFVILNGESLQVTNPADLNTNTISLINTGTAQAGDVVLSKIEVDTAPVAFDFCRANKGYMFYGSWDRRQLYMSNGFNKSYDYRVTSFQALQNDLILDLSSPYTGTVEGFYKLVIQEANPDVNVQTYTGEGLNDARFNDTGYTALGDTQNTYKVVVVADFSLLVNGTGNFAIGEVIEGSVTNATARVVAIIPNGPNWSIACQMLANTEFIGGVGGETITGQSSGTAGVIQNGAGFGAFYQNWIQYFKNDVLTSITSSTITGTTVPIFTNLTVTLTDGLLIEFGNYTGHIVGDFWELAIRRGGQDRFVWQKDGGAISAPIAITGGTQTLSDGVAFNFAKANGHSIGDFWNITASPRVTRAWVNFYYGIPRKPGEGYIYRLPSNFWTMNTQEESMYINSSYGEWSIVSTTLSSDLLSEDVSLTPLKQAGSNKVLYPYLTGHLDNDLVFITIDKGLSSIGRLQMYEKPQMNYLSDPVAIDFDTSSFIGGRINYVNDVLYISSPQEGILHCLDTVQNYWQPPKRFPEVGLLSIIGNDLVAHSDTRNQTFSMFTNGAGDNGQAYEVIIRTPYTSMGNRWKKKNSSATFVEGYITGNPLLDFTVIQGVKGCQGMFTHRLKPVVCTAPDRAPFGHGPFGSHSFGSDFDIEGSHFQEIYKAYSPIMEYYLVALQLQCSAKSHTYQILSLGINGILANKGNNRLVNDPIQPL